MKELVPTSRTNWLVSHRDFRMFPDVHWARFNGAALKKLPSLKPAFRMRVTKARLATVVPRAATRIGSSMPGNHSIGSGTIFCKSPEGTQSWLNLILSGGVRRWLRQPKSERA